MLKNEEKCFENLEYIERKPENFDKNKKYPVLLYLHGAGTRRTDLKYLQQNYIFSATEKFPEYEFILIVPFCNSDTWFDYGETLKKFAYFIKDTNYVDENRVYLSGCSMGGYGTWALAMSIPEVFAAAVPICGGGLYWNAGRLVSMPVWAFHGGKDTTVFPEESKKMVDHINKWGGNAKLTIYENNGHDAWTDTYNNPEVYKWIFSQVKKSTNTKELEINGKIYG